MIKYVFVRFYAMSRDNEGAQKKKDLWLGRLGHVIKYVFVRFYAMSRDNEGAQTLIHLTRNSRGSSCFSRGFDIFSSCLERTAAFMAVVPTEDTLESVSFLFRKQTTSYR